MRRHSCEDRPGFLGGHISEHHIIDVYDRGDDSTTVATVTLECDGCGESWTFSDTTWRSMKWEDREKTASIDPDSSDPKPVERTQEERFEIAEQIDGLRTEKAKKGLRRRMGYKDKAKES